MTARQNAAVLALLRKAGRRGVTPLQALNEVGSLRLSARIYDLKREGYDIVTESVRVGTGARVARYVLFERPQQLTLDGRTEVVRP